MYDIWKRWNIFIMIKQVITLLTVNTTVGSVSTSPQTRSTIYLNMFDKQAIYVQTFDISVRFGISQKLQQEVGGLLWPATLSHAPLFGLKIK